MKLSPPGAGSLMSANQWLPTGRLARNAARFMPCHWPRCCSAKAASLHHVGRLWKAGGPDRFRGLMRAHQIARIPDRIARQDFCDRLEHFAIAGVALDILLAVDVAAVAAHRRMTHPPPPRGDDCWFAWIGHREDPFHSVCRRCTSEHTSSQVTSRLKSCLKFRSAASAGRVVTIQGRNSWAASKANPSSSPAPASGIGRAASLLFTKEGAKLIAVDRSEGVKETAKLVSDAGGTVEAVMADAGSETDVKAFIDKAVVEIRQARRDLGQCRRQRRTGAARRADRRSIGRKCCASI